MDLDTPKMEISVINDSSMMDDASVNTTTINNSLIMGRTPRSLRKSNSLDSRVNNNHTASDLSKSIPDNSNLIPKDLTNKENSLNKLTGVIPPKRTSQRHLKAII